LDFFEVVKKRYSEKKGFVRVDIPLKNIEKIVDAGRIAPSALNFQTTEFIIVTERNLIDKISDVIEKEYLKDASALILLVSDFNKEYVSEDLKVKYYVHDAAAAMENILLAITAMGYAGCWIDARLRMKDNSDRISQLLGIPDDRKIFGLIPIGKPKEYGVQREKKPFEERVFYNKYGKRKTDII